MRVFRPRSCCRHWMVERLLLNAALLAARAAAPRPAFSWDTVPYFVHCQTPLPCPPRAPPPGPGPFCPPPPGLNPAHGMLGTHFG